MYWRGTKANNGLVYFICFANGSDSILLQVEKCKKGISMGIIPFCERAELKMGRTEESVEDRSRESNTYPCVQQ